MIIFWSFFLLFSFIIIFFDKKYCMLRDSSKATSHQPYSWARVQLAWWTVIVLSAFVSIMWIKDVAPTLHYSTVILLGISAVTTTTARIIDVSDQEKLNSIRHQDWTGQNFFVDILSDQAGVSVHRFQAVVFNAAFGVWFIIAVLNNLSHDCAAYTNDAATSALCMADHINYIMPPISNNNLLLLGLSSATYAALKITENRSATLAQQTRNLPNNTDAYNTQAASPAPNNTVPPPNGAINN